MNEKQFNGHNGFEQKYMQEILKNSGFSNIISATFFHGEKTYQEKRIPYSLFFAIGNKKHLTS